MARMGLLAVAFAVAAAGCPGDRGEGDAERTPERRLAEAERALLVGRGGLALGALGEAEGPGFDLMRVRAYLQMKRWGDAAELAAKARGAEAKAMACELASAREDVDAERRCRAAIAELPEDVRLKLALAATLDRMHRPAEAEEILRAVVTESGDAAARDALIRHLERFGWVREAVAEAEAWLRAEPDRDGLTGRLVHLLERKVRGDLLEKRGEDALAAARRVLELAPDRTQMRYFLADALELTGDSAGAAEQRAKAKAAGATPPPDPGAVPTVPH